MTNIVEQLFQILNPWPGFEIVSFESRVSPIDGKKVLLLRLAPIEGSMPICSRCHHEAPLIHEYVTRRISDRTILDYSVQLEVRIRRVECLHCKGCCQEYVDWLRPYHRCTERLRDHIEHRVKEETVAYAAQETDQSWDTVKAIDKTRLERDLNFHRNSTVPL